jgi:putative flavoprotein involved in K+ transport
VELVGRFHEANGHRVRFGTSEELEETVAAADRRMHRFLDIADHCLHTDVVRDRLDEWPVFPDGSPARPRPVRLGATRERVGLWSEGISTIVVATGYRPHHPWLRVPVTEPDGAIWQVRGATPAPGLYVVGQRFQHRRDSATLDGARHIARDVVSHLCADDARSLRDALCEMEETG